MTGLEALERIKGFDKTRNRSAIEYFLEQEIMDTCFEIVEKELKALKLIINKGVAVGMLQLKEVGLNEYNDFIGDKSLFLTKEEYHLLKEILENG